jgi:pimeloyl-ACP methyl ester carboxylesterase
VSVHLPAAGSAFEILDGVGHFLHLEKPELIAAKIADWLSA